MFAWTSFSDGCEGQCGKARQRENYGENKQASVAVKMPLSVDISDRGWGN